MAPFRRSSRDAFGTVHLITRAFGVCMSVNSVTIGMPVYNGADTLSVALDSLLGQTFRDVTIVISDNASTDGTEAIGRDYAARDPRVRYVRQAVNLGAAMNYRFVLFEARTPYFMWAAADDLWAPNFVETHLAVLERDPGVVMSQSRVLFVADGRPLNVATGTFALLDDPLTNARNFLRNPADNSRYYGVFRTHALQAVFPIRSFFALDWAVSAATLRFGRHHEVHDILMIRDTTDPTAYGRAIAADHRLWLWRVFPMLYMTRWLLAGRYVPMDGRILYNLGKLNLYMHLRFGLYRWQRAADLYLNNNSARQTLKAMIGGWMRAITAPGLGRRLRQAVQQARQFARRAAYGVWRRLPLADEQRKAVKRFVMRLSGRSGYSRVEPAAAPSTPGGRPPLPMYGWRMPQPGGAGISVVLVVHDDLQRTLAVVDAIAAAQSETAAELILVDNGSSDTTSAVFSALPGVIHRRLPRRRSFAAAATEGLRAANGTALIFLDAGTAIRPDFLAACVAGLERAALVGPQIRSPNSTLVAAGGLVAADRGLSGYGAGTPVDHPSVLFARETDFCPGAFAIKRETLDALGGLTGDDSTFDIASLDLAVRVRGAGMRVLYWPDAIATAWPDADPAPLAALREVDFDRFLARNPAALQDLADATGLAPHDRRRTRRLLFIDADTPTPDRSAGAILSLNLMRMLDMLGFRISFVPESNVAYAGKYTQDLQALGIEALYYPYYPTVRAVLEQRGAEFDVIFACRAYIGERYIDMIRGLAPHARIVFNTIDLHFVREMREADLFDDPRRRAQAEATRASELRSVNAADVTVVVSSHEAEILREAAPDACVHVLPLLFDVPPRPPAPCLAGRRDLMFVGTYQHPPNRDAAIYFAREIWPGLRERLPEGTRFLVVGSSITPEIEALAGNGVDVLGFVDDLDAVLATCRLTVAPLRFGAGLKGKVASSLLAGVPVVATPIAVEGTPLRDGVDVLIADSTEAFAEAVLRLYSDAALWEQLSRAGYDFVRHEYSLETNAPRLLALLRDAGVAIAAETPNDGAAPAPLSTIAQSTRLAG